MHKAQVSGRRDERSGGGIGQLRLFKQCLCVYINTMLTYNSGTGSSFRRLADSAVTCQVSNDNIENGWS